MKTSRLLAALLPLFFWNPVYALRIETGNDIRITETVGEDLYVFGSNLDIEAPVWGDLWCAGGTITVADTLRGDLVATGGNLYVRGVVLDDIRAAGGTLNISGIVRGDIVVAGGTVIIEPSAEIGGDLIVSGGTLTLGSTVHGKVKVYGGNVTLNGALKKGLEFDGEKLTLDCPVDGSSMIAARTLEIGKNAAISGPVRYWTDKGEVDFGNALRNGATAAFDPALRDRMDLPDYRFLGFASLMAVLWYLTSAFLLLALGQWLFPKTFHRAAGTARLETMRSLGFGFLYFAAVPVGIVLLFITLIGVPAGLIALFFYGMFFALSGVMTALAAAHWVNRRKNYQWKPLQLIFAALGLLVLLNMLSMIPIIGWMVKAAAVMIVFGAILINTGIFADRRRPIEEPANE